MNLNSSNSQDQLLRQAVQEQLDLIIKMEQERKSLKKQNKLLHQKLKQFNTIISKYQKQTKSVETCTQNLLVQNKDNSSSSESSKHTNIIKIYQEYGLQVQLNIQNMSNVMNCSKLSQAQSLLKTLQVYESRAMTSLNQKQEQNKKNIRKQKSNQKISKPNQSSNNREKQLASQIVKITKQLNIVKKQLKQVQHKFKLREKQIKDLKKCLQNKNEALQKSRKQFNQLSILMNQQKFKSVRTLQQQVNTLKGKLISQQQSSKLKSMLGGITQEYSDYRKQSQKRIDALVSQLATKQTQITFLQNELRKNKSKVQI